jgi:DNA processing protein
MNASDASRALLRLTLVEGVGPVLGRRLITAFSSARGVFDATPGDLEKVQGIGATNARRIWESMRESEEALERELASAERLGARIIALGDAAYPPLLAECHDAPLVLYVRGADPTPVGTFPVGIVGSRHCTHYGVEQAERFSTALAQAGLVVVSGGARGVDSAAHRAAARLNFPTVVVLGCGLGHCYPPENAELFQQVVASGGTILSELPIGVGPSAENFPARNRIIVGLSLGVVVIEAPRGSGALITARLAIDDYNREVLAVPGRIDSRASEGSNDLIKKGEAAMATSPADVIDALEIAARHLHAGTHEPRFAPGAALASLFDHPERAGGEADGSGPGAGMSESDAGTGARGASAAMPADSASVGTAGMSAGQRQIMEALDTPRSIDELCRTTGLPAHTVQAEVMLLEVRRAVVRQGSKLARRGKVNE